MKMLCACVSTCIDTVNKQSLFSASDGLCVYITIECIVGVAGNAFVIAAFAR